MENWTKYLPESYTYCDFDKNQKDCVAFRVKEITDQSTAEVWMEEFSKASYTTWRVLKTFPDSGRKNLFRKQFRCQHSTDKRASGAGPSKNTNCPVKMEVIIRRYCKKTKARNVDPVIKDFPTMIIIKGIHNHPTVCAESLKFRDMAFETQEKLKELFRKGYSPSAAHYSLKMDLMLSSGDQYYKLAADGQYLPTLSKVSKLFTKEFEGEYGSFDGEEMFNNLQSILHEHEISGGKGICSKTANGENYFVNLCTPVMLRAHQKISQSSEVVMVDAAGGMDKQRHRIYVFVTPTAAGGIPLGVIITDSEKESVFKEALISFKKLLPESAFFSKKYPQVFITDNDMKERNALGQVFPESTLLLCQFHMLKSMWSWLCNKHHAIDPQERQSLYFLFKNVLYSSSEERVEENVDIFLKKVQQLKQNNLEKHLNSILSYKEDWISFYRNDKTTRGNNTTNYVEIVFRILKDIIFQRTLAFNLTQLVDFIITRYEMYLVTRLTDFVNGRYSNILLAKMIPKESYLKSATVKEDTEGHFQVNAENETYHVDLVRGLCSCNPGKCGKLCKHASVVYINLEHASTAFNIANTETKALMFFVASGEEPEHQWFQPLKDRLPNTTDDLDDNPQAHLKESEVSPSAPSSALKKPSESEVDQSEEVQHQLQILFDRIKRGINSNPEVFLPASKRMLKNAAVSASTETGLLTAMHTFGTYSGVKSAKQLYAKRLVRRCHKNIIGVQPTAIGRRKLLISGRRKLNVGRPSGRAPPKELEEHKYTTFGTLPSRKRKAPHNLEQCVYDNKLLGGTKHKKNL